MTTTISANDYYDSPECREAFKEWLSPDSGTSREILATAQQASAGHVAPIMLKVPVASWCEYIHNVLVGKGERYEELIDHLMVDLQELYESKYGYLSDVQEWLADAHADMSTEYAAWTAWRNNRI